MCVGTRCCCFLVSVNRARCAALSVAAGSTLASAAFHAAAAAVDLLNPGGDTLLEVVGTVSLGFGSTLLASVYLISGVYFRQAFLLVLWLGIFALKIAAKIWLSVKWTMRAAGNLGSQAENDADFYRGELEAAVASMAILCVLLYAHLFSVVYTITRNLHKENNYEMKVLENRASAKNSVSSSVSTVTDAAKEYDDADNAGEMFPAPEAIATGNRTLDEAVLW